MARKRKAAAQPAPEQQPAAEPARPNTVLLQAQAKQNDPQVTSGYVGVFPTPKQEAAPVRIEPKRPEEPEQKFLGTGMYAVKLASKRTLMVQFVNGEYRARGEELINWCREHGFPEA